MPAAIITGASSGIGRALALELAARGWDVGLLARRTAALEEVAAEIARRFPGRRTAVESADVADPDRTRAAIQALFTALPEVELVIANAGISGQQSVGSGHFARARAIIETNLIGAMATVDAAIECWRSRPAQGRRCVAGITSVAGFRALPGSIAYSASKAGLSVYLEGVRGEVRSLGIDVVDLAPGFIDTPLNEDLPSRPFLIDATEGARRIADLLARRPYRATVPTWPWTAIGWLMRALPDWAWVRVGAAAGPRSSRRA